METPNLRLEKNRNSCERTAWVVVSVIFIGFYRKKKTSIRMCHVLHLIKVHTWLWAPFTNCNYKIENNKGAGLLGQTI